MNKQYSNLDTKDPRESMHVFREGPPTGVPLAFTKGISTLRCAKCGQFAAKDALHLGVSPNADIPRMTVDALFSEDDMLVVSGRSKEVLSSVPGANVNYYEIPSRPGYWVAYPQHVIVPPTPSYIYNPVEWFRDGDAFSHTRPCKKCGRYEYVTMLSERVHIPDGVILAGILLERVPNESIDWVANASVVDAIEKARLTGWRIRRGAYAN